jgi:hypothetical protein
MKKLVFLVGVAVGYVLGSRAGRERYEQIKTGATKVAQNPTVQDAVGKAQDAVTHQAAVVADAAKEKVAEVAHRD